MTTRVTESEVKEIMDTDLTVEQITPYLISANSFVTGVFASVTIDDSVLKEIERWLAAHMVSLTKERVSQEEGAGGAYIKWAGKFGEKLSATQYGQMVMSLDYTNTLSNLEGGKKEASIYVVPGV